MDCLRLLTITSPDHRDTSKNRGVRSSTKDGISFDVVRIGKTALETGRSWPRIGDR